MNSTEDWYLAALDRIGRSARVACVALLGTVEAFEPGRGERIAGVSMAEITDHLMAAGAREKRRAADEAIREYVDAVHAHRVGVIRAMVDEDGMSLSDVAHRIEISRQMAARLYHDTSAVDTAS